MNTKVISGTPETQTEHSQPAAMLGLAVSMGVPAAIAVIGIIAEGFTAISWAGAVVWGIVATLAFTLFSLMGKAMGMTRMDLLDLLGSVVATPHTSASRALGAMIHHVNGALLAVAWAYAVALFNGQANWVSGVIWGVVVWGLALLMMSSIGAVHPAMRRGGEEDPGPAAINFGKMTPVGSLLGHLVYGAVLGAGYQLWLG